jgi:hypothetical protein
LHGTFYVLQNFKIYFDSYNSFKLWDSGLVWWLVPTMPAILEAETRRSMVQGEPEKIVNKNPSQQIYQVWWNVPEIPVTWET